MRTKLQKCETVWRNLAEFSNAEPSTTSFRYSSRPRCFAAVWWFLFRGRVLRPEDACQKRSSWFSDWNPNVQKCVNFVDLVKSFQTSIKASVAPKEKWRQSYSCRAVESCAMSKRSSLSMYVIATVFCSNFHFSVSLHVPFSQFLFERDSYSNEYLDVFSIYLQKSASIQPITSGSKFADISSILPAPSGHRYSSGGRCRLRGGSSQRSWGDTSHVPVMPRLSYQLGHLDRPLFHKRFKKILSLLFVCVDIRSALHRLVGMLTISKFSTMLCSGWTRVIRCHFCSPVALPSASFHSFF